jgi:hypothetical protein
MLICRVNAAANLDFHGIQIQIHVTQIVEHRYFHIHRVLLIIVHFNAFASQDGIGILLQILVYLIVLLCRIAMHGKI